MTDSRLIIVLSVIEREPVTTKGLKRICSKMERRYLLRKKLIKRRKNRWVVTNTSHRESKQRKHNAAIQTLYSRYGQGATKVSFNSLFFTDAGKIRPDMIIERDGHIIAFEAELHQKTKYKAAEKLCAYDLISDIDEIVYAFQTIEQLVTYRTLSRELGLCTKRFRFILL